MKILGMSRKSSPEGEHFTLKLGGSDEPRNLGLVFRREPEGAVDAVYWGEKSRREMKNYDDLVVHTPLSFRDLSGAVDFFLDLHNRSSMQEARAARIKRAERIEAGKRLRGGIGDRVGFAGRLFGG